MVTTGQGTCSSARSCCATAKATLDHARAVEAAPLLYLCPTQALYI